MATVMSVVYFNKVVDILEESPEMKKTFTSAAKQAGCAAAGAAVGGLLGGRNGAVIGTFLGALVGYAYVDDYQTFMKVLRNLSDDEKYRMQKKMQALVGSVSIEELKMWIKTEVNRESLMTLMNKAVKAP